MAAEDDRCAEEAEEDLREEGVEALAVTGAWALLFATSASKLTHDDIPSLLPSWFTAKDSQWSVRSAADNEKRWHKDTPDLTDSGGIRYNGVPGRWGGREER